MTYTGIDVTTSAGRAVNTSDSQPNPPTGLSVEVVSTGATHTCAIKASGQLFCWGNGANVQLGLGSNTSADTPTRVPGILLQ